MVDHPERKPAWAPVLEPALPLALFWHYTLEADAICPPAWQPRRRKPRISRVR